MKKLALAALLILFALALRCWQLGLIPKMYFDEFHYVYDALKFLNGLLPLERGSAATPKHPLLPVALIQFAISLFGNNYLGWRIFPVLLGTGSVVFMFLLARELFSFRAAAIATFLLSIDFLHLLLSRVAMVDIFGFFFMLGGYYFLARSLKDERSAGILLAGLFFGLSLACKLPFFIPVLAALAIYSHTKTPPQAARHFGVGIYLTQSCDRSKSRNGLLYLFFTPLIVLVLVSAYLNFSAGMTLRAWTEFEVVNLINTLKFSYVHPFATPAWTWPLVLLPTPFVLIDLGHGLVSLVFAFGNPLVYWPLVPVMLYLIRQYLRSRNSSLSFVLIGFWFAYLLWLSYDLLGGRHLFFYYFLPLLPFYLLGLAYLLDKLMFSRRGRLLAALYLLLVFLAFIYYSP
ncbi:MAG TPA: glycosyltransferase family 39 protein, partial [Candidatus Sulfotelmatobacter sp.]|nr:glycosyltransferase family 39 protein [Candidatus Sulfotelmatobacter sp.]